MSHQVNAAYLKKIREKDVSYSPSSHAVIYGNVTLKQNKNVPEKTRM